ncbi:RNA exonuclease 4 [Protobothrops mucrosquamatus]|uniref:RNA exonuclease 4 n=1 Tax=Protobothrops mucrosquamatus TaxID=103944 RepID=UPI000775D708|nr:RNA exonuclease 4 [Protobothrops mucrosquamatus]
MTKMKKKDSPSQTDNSTTKPDNLKNQRKKKKKKNIFWKKINQVEKRASKETKAVVELPPKTSQEVSSNWKALQELLQQKASCLNSAVTAPNTYSKKKDVKTVPCVSGPNGIGKKLTSKVQVPSLSPAGVTRSKKSTQVKKPPQVQEAAKEQRNVQVDNGEKKQGDIKHKRRKQDDPVAAASIDIWFDDVDPDDIEAALGPEAAKVARENLGIKEERIQQTMEPELVKEHAFEGLTKAVAIDCEMVGVGPTGEDSILARVSVVNLFGKCIYDKYVKATEKVTDYRTAVSGIRPEHLKTGEDFRTVQKDIADILRGRILVGHALHNDLKILLLDHPKKKIRDTQRYKPFKKQVKSLRPSLKLLCDKLLNVKVQTSEHSSVQDAQAAMRLYTLVKKEWEASLKGIPKAQKD